MDKTQKIFKMYNNEKEYDFTITDSYYSPNEATMSGYGSDDWYFLCKENNNYGILLFSISAEFGKGVWDFVYINEEDYQRIIGDIVKIQKYYWDNWKGKKHLKLHPRDIDSAYELINTKIHRTGIITEEIITGI